MPRRAHGLRTRMVASGRKTFWVGGTIVNSVLAAANSALIVTSLSVSALALRPFTVVRTRGVWSFFSDQIAADEDQQVAFGGIVVSDEAVAVGITAVPTPVEQDSSSWLFYDMAFQRFEQQSAIGIYPAMIPWNNVIDSKSMRKVDEGQDLVEVIQNGAGSEGSTVTTFVKHLIKLH